MNTKQLLNNFVRLRDELPEQGANERWVAQRKLLVTLLTLYRAQLEYEKAKARYDIHIEFLEADKPLTKKDRDNLKEAFALNKKFSTQLIELKTPIETKKRKKAKKGR